MGNLERLWTFTAAERAIVSISGQAEITLHGVTPCDSFFSVLSGCGDTVASFLANFVLGTVSGAPDRVNVVLAVYINVLVVIALFKWGRGVNDQ